MATWFYNSDTGGVQNWLDWVSLHSGLGWHGPFDTKAAALKYYEDNKAKNPGWKEPTGLVGTLKNGLAATPDEVSRAAGKAKDAVKDVTEPFRNINLGNWLLRIGEILLGIVLIGVGMARITGVQNQVAKIVKAAI